MALDSERLQPAYRAALLFSAALNAVMLVVEGGVGLHIGSAALIADAVDFLEDTGLYLIAVLALGWSARRRGAVAVVMSLFMAGVGLTALWQVWLRLTLGGAPAPAPLAGTALTALVVNVICAWRLAPWKRGDASMRSIWLSTRNDALLNALTIAAGGMIALTGAGWPDIAAGLLIAGLNLAAAAQIARQAVGELKGG